MYERQKAKSRKTKAGKKYWHIPEKVTRCTTPAITAFKTSADGKQEHNEDGKSKNLKNVFTKNIYLA